MSTLTVEPPIQYDNGDFLIDLHFIPSDVRAKAFLNSGSQKNLLDKKYYLQMPQRPKPSQLCIPIILRNADGQRSKLGLVKNEVTMDIVIANDHQKITFLLVNLPKHKIFLGSPWLQTHNPKIDWNQTEASTEV